MRRIVLVAVLVAGCGAQPRERPSPRGTIGAVEINVSAVSPPAAGTGWVYDARRGLVVTAAHVTNGGAFVEVKTGARPWQRARVVGSSPCADVALLRLRDTRGLVTVTLGDQGDLLRGERVVAFGYAADRGRRSWQTYGGAVRDPRVAFHPDRQNPDTPELRDLVQTTSLTRPGLSGGPIVDVAERLVGMTFGGWTSRSGRVTTLAVGVDGVRAALAGFSAGSARGSAGTGLFFPTGRRRVRGVVVTGLAGVPDGGYPHGGVLVTAVDGAPVGNTLASWCRTAGALAPGAATFTIVRRPGAAPETVTDRMNRSGLASPAA